MYHLIKGVVSQCFPAIFKIEARLKPSPSAITHTEEMNIKERYLVRYLRKNEL